MFCKRSERTGLLYTTRGGQGIMLLDFHATRRNHGSTRRGCDTKWCSRLDALHPRIGPHRSARRPRQRTTTMRAHRISEENVSGTSLMNAGRQGGCVGPQGYEKGKMEELWRTNDDCGEVDILGRLQVALLEACDSKPASEARAPLYRGACSTAGCRRLCTFTPRLGSLNRIHKALFRWGDLSTRG